MAVGLAAAVANGWLNTIKGTAYTAPAGSFIKLHTADPGVGATAPSANTTRVAITWTTSTAGSLVSSNTPSWASWASGSETISHISIWDTVGPAGGNLVATIALTTPKAMTNGDTLNLTSAGTTITLTPIAT